MAEAPAQQPHDEQQRFPTLAETIDYLFRTIRRGSRDDPADDRDTRWRASGRKAGTEYSMEEVANWCRAWLQARGHDTFSKEYLRQLRSGGKTNPNFVHIQALAAFFDAPPEIFHQPEKRSEFMEQLDLLVQLRERNVLGLALRAGELSEQNRKKLTAAIERMLRQQDDS